MKRIGRLVLAALWLFMASGCGQATVSDPESSLSEASSSALSSTMVTTTTATDTTSTNAETTTSTTATGTETTANKTTKTTEKSTTTKRSTTVTTALSRELGESVIPTPKTVHFIGRQYFLTASLRYGWKYSNSGLEFSFRGTGAQVQLASTKYPQRFKVWIDGRVTTEFVLDKAAAIEVAAGLTNGDHHCKILQMNEPNGGTTYAEKITASQGGTLYRREESAPRQMLVIGDSITCGYGVLEGTEAFQAGDGTQIYQQQAADSIGNIEVQTVAVSGIGIARNSGNPNPHSGGALTMFTDYGYEGEGYHPDLIVIALGTNDAGAGDNELVEDATKFLKTVLKKYPGTPVIWSYGLMGVGKAIAIRTAVEQVSKELKVDNLYILPHKGPTPEEGIGLHGHPALATHTRVAGELAAKIREVMGW